MASEEEIDFNSASRRALFGKDAHEIPGAGTSAADTPARHVRVKVTMNLDGDLVAYFKKRAGEQGRSYQLLINEALREIVEGTRPERLAKEVRELLVADEAFLQQIKESLEDK